MDARELKGLQIAATTSLKRSSRGWIVPSQAGRGTYLVAPTDRTVAHVDTTSDLGCTCPDYEERGLPCKHVIAVELTIKREVTADGEILTQQVRVTYSQNWAAYNQAQTREKELFAPMLADLCSTISNPPQGKGRPRLPMSDMAFTAIAKVYAGLSARRFDTDVREASSRDLIAQDPHFNSVLRYLRSPEMTPVLIGLVELSAKPLAGVETDFAADSTGFSTCRYVRWYDHKWGKEMSKREWVKLHAMTGVLTNVVTAVRMTPNHGEGTSDYRQFEPLLARTAESFVMRAVMADKAYSGQSNLIAAGDLDVVPYIPFKGVPAAQPGELAPEPPDPRRTTTWTRMYHQFIYQRETFLARYHQRSNVETTFSMIKAKFGDSLRSKSETGQFNEVLCKVVAHNLCCLISAMYELGLEAPEFGEATRLLPA